MSVHFERFEEVSMSILVEPTRAEVPGASTTSAGQARRAILENGAHVTAHEFMHLYQAAPNVHKAELIEGVVHMPSLVSARHAICHQKINLWLGYYQVNTPGTETADNATLRLDTDNSVQPDAVLYSNRQNGSSVQIDADGYLEGKPELVVEIAYSSASYDLHEKFRVYRRNGVREYMVWQVETPRLDWWELHESTYVSLASDGQGIVMSRAFPGLVLDVNAMLNDDMGQVLAALQSGIGSADHAAFVKKLSD